MRLISLLPVILTPSLLLATNHSAQDSELPSRLKAVRIEALRELDKLARADKRAQSYLQVLVGKQWLELDPEGGLAYVSRTWKECECYRGTSNCSHDLFMKYVAAKSPGHASELLAGIGNKASKARCTKLYEEAVKEAEQGPARDDVDQVQRAEDLYLADNPYALRDYMRGIEGYEWVRRDLAIRLAPDDLKEALGQVNLIEDVGWKAFAQVSVAMAVKTTAPQQYLSLIDNVLQGLAQSKLRPDEKLREFDLALWELAKNRDERVMPYLYTFIESFYADIDSWFDAEELENKDQDYIERVKSTGLSELGAMISYFDLGAGDAIFKQAQDLHSVATITPGMCSSYISYEFQIVLENILLQDAVKAAQRLRSDLLPRDADCEYYIIPTAVELVETIADSDPERARLFLMHLAIPDLILELDTYYSLKSGASPIAQLMKYKRRARAEILSRPLQEIVVEYVIKMCEKDLAGALDLLDCLDSAEDRFESRRTLARSLLIPGEVRLTLLKEALQIARTEKDPDKRFGMMFNITHE